VAIAARRLPVLETAAAEISQLTGNQVLPIQVCILLDTYFSCMILTWPEVASSLGERDKKQLFFSSL
jgi:hypothetical protein